MLVDRNGACSGLSSVSLDDCCLEVRRLLNQGLPRFACVGAQFDIREDPKRLEGGWRAVAAAPEGTLEVITADGLTVIGGRRANPDQAARPPDRAVPTPSMT